MKFVLTLSWAIMGVGAGMMFGANMVDAPPPPVVHTCLAEDSQGHLLMRASCPCPEALQSFTAWPLAGPDGILASWYDVVTVEGGEYRRKVAWPLK